MSPTRKKTKFAEIRVGILVVASFVILALAVLYISAGSSILGPTFKAVTYLPNVGGLKPGAPVQLAGVEVGSVEQVRILPRELEPKNEQNLEIARRTESVGREIQARKEKQTLYQEEMQRLTAQNEELKQSRRTNTQEFKKLQTVIAELKVNLESNLNIIANLDDEEIRLRQSIQNVEVILKVDQRYRSWIRKDSEVGVGSIGLLGDKYIDITLGRSESPSSQDERGYSVITGKMQADFRELITGIDDVVGNFGVLSQRFRNLTNKLEEGSVAQFIGDRSFYDNLNTTLAEASTTLKTATELIKEIKEGRGTMGRLISEDKLYSEVNTATSQTNKLLQKVNSGEGSLGKFIANPSVYDKADSVLASADTIANRITKGEGTLGKLSKDEALYERTKLALEKFANLVDEVEQGKGSLGMLVKDKTLYDNLTQASSEVVKLLYDFRQDPKKYLTIRFRVF
jgi:phospholipid/cholesterol/gamma-HCH transport system substrate-binding protein